MGISLAILGGSGSFGSALAKEVLSRDDITRVIIFSRGWERQNILREELGNPGKFRWFIGDVRDLERLRLALRKVDWVVNAAAMKEVNACSYNPLDAYAVNYEGQRNVCWAALDCGVQKVLFVGSDKQNNPTGTYGVSKQAAADLTIAFNAYAGSRNTRYAVAKWGNILGSTGSVLQVWERRHRAGKPLGVVDARRFWWPIRNAAQFALQCLEHMEGGETYVPDNGWASIRTLAEIAFPNVQLEPIPLRPGDKPNEILVTEYEFPRVRDLGWAYRIDPLFRSWDADGQFSVAGSPVIDYAIFTSASGRQLTHEELRRMLK